MSSSSLEGLFRRIQINESLVLLPCGDTLEIDHCTELFGAALQNNTFERVALCPICNFNVKNWTRKKNTNEQHIFTLNSIENAINTVLPLYIQTMTSKTITVEINSSGTILELKEKIEMSDGIPVGQQRLIWNGRQLEDDRRLYEYGIQREATIQLVLRLAGD